MSAKPMPVQNFELVCSNVRTAFFHAKAKIFQAIHHLPEWQYFSAKKVSQRTFFVLSIIKFLLDKVKQHTGMDIDWSKRIIHLLDTRPFVPNFEKHMGLPTDWKQIDLWR